MKEKLWAVTKAIISDMFPGMWDLAEANVRADINRVMWTGLISAVIGGLALLMWFRFRYLLNRTESQAKTEQLKGAIVLTAIITLIGIAFAGFNGWCYYDLTQNFQFRVLAEFFRLAGIF